jgi:hypothetical protein
MYVTRRAFATLSSQPFGALRRREHPQYAKAARAFAEDNKRSMRVPINTRDTLEKRGGERLESEKGSVTEAECSIGGQPDSTSIALPIWAPGRIRRTLLLGRFC